MIIPRTFLKLYNEMFFKTLNTTHRGYSNILPSILISIFFFTNDNIFIHFLIFRLKIWKNTVLFSFDSKCFKTTEKLQEILICSAFSMTNMFLPESDSCRQIKQFRRKLLSCNKNINKKFFDRADYRFLLMSRLESSF